MREIVIVGGGVAGVEMSLALAALRIPDTRLTLVSERDTLLVLPNLVYAPFAGSSDVSDIPLSFLGQLGIELVLGRATHIDHGARRVQLGDGRQVAYEDCVLALGAVPSDGGGNRFRSLQDAARIQAHLRALPFGRGPVEITVRIDGEAVWTPPAYELVFLIDGWLRANARRYSATITVATDEPTPCAPLGHGASALIAAALAARDIELVSLAAAPEAAELEVHIGALRAAVVDGLEPHLAGGFLQTDGSGRLTDHLYAVGDATSMPVKGGFCLPWHTRRVALALSGQPRTDGPLIHNAFLYQMDMHDDTLSVWFDDSRAQPVPVSAAIDQVAVEKLKGTLLGARLRERLGVPAESFHRREQVMTMMRAAGGSSAGVA